MEPYYLTEMYMAEKLRAAERTRLLAIARGRDGRPSLPVSVGHSIRTIMGRRRTSAEPMGPVACVEPACCPA